MSMTPAFSPGPWITHGALVGKVRRWIFEDLYEQCSFHIAEKMPSSVKAGVRPISLRMRAYSSGLRPWAATSAAVMVGFFAALGLAVLGGRLALRATSFLTFRAAGFFDVLAIGLRCHWLVRPAIHDRAGSTASCMHSDAA